MVVSPSAAQTRPQPASFREPGALLFGPVAVGPEKARVRADAAGPSVTF